MRRITEWLTIPLRSDYTWFTRLSALVVYLIAIPAFCCCGLLVIAPDDTSTDDLQPKASQTALAMANQTATVIAQTPSDTPTETLTPTATLTPSETPTSTDTLTPSETFTPSETPVPTDTLTPSDTPTITDTPEFTATPTPTATLEPAKRSEQVVYDLHDTDIHDSDFRGSTGIFDDRAVVNIFLSKTRNSSNPERDAFNQAYHDFPILACDLKSTGFTEAIFITGLAVLDNDQEGEVITVTLDHDAIASMDCSDTDEIDVFALDDQVEYLPSLAEYFEDYEDRPRPTIRPTEPDVESLTRVLYITGQTVNIRACASTSCDIRGSLKRGDRIEATGLYQDEWYRFTYQGEDGWVSASLTSTTRPAAATSVPRATTVPRATFTFAPPPTSGGVSCGGATTCTQMTSCQQAYACLYAGDSGLDADDDGIPCESICPGG